jgi:hypothetical protein
MENASEIDVLKAKYPKVFAFHQKGVSLLFEWVSPKNQIVIKHNEPDIELVGAVRHEDYSLFAQEELDILACNLDVPRPRKFKFSNYENLTSSINEIQDFEGVCVYSNDG